LRDLCETAYRSVGRDWAASVVSDPALVRPLEPGRMLADSARARELLGWRPTVSFEEMVARMVDAQTRRLKNAIQTR